MRLRYLRAGRTFRTIIDIGANEGAVAADLQRQLGAQRVICFEPLPVYAAELAGRGFEARELALSDAEGRCRFRAGDTSAVSSALPLTEAALAEWPGIAAGHDIEVRTARLDDVIGPFEPDLFIKVDAQGAEAAIIRGGADTFRRASAVLIEQTFVPIYDGQALFNEVHAALAGLGLGLTGFRGQYVSETSGRPMFAHCIYERAA